MRSELKDARTVQRLAALAIATGGLFVSIPIPRAYSVNPSAALKSYVNQPDSTYAVQPGTTWNDGDVEFTELQLTSQTFQNKAWTHVLAIARPKSVSIKNHCLLFVGNGRNDDKEIAKGRKLPPESAGRLARLATSSGMLVAEIRQIPNQPIFDGKIEDDAIALTLTEFFKTGDFGWPLLEPMVKAVVRAIDAIQNHAAKTWQLDITGVTLTGESKRAWTSWLTAAVDSRVKALAPLVFDMLNMRPQLTNQLKSWGKYSGGIL